MPGKFKCPFSKEELQMIYDSEGMTIKKMCGIVGCKSDITMAKILKENGIDTNNNKRVAFSKRGNRSDDEFKSFLVNEYLEKKRSMTNIAKELGVARIIVSRYLDKYGIPKRTKSEQQRRERSSNWHGGRGITSHGYVKIFLPEHPFASSAGYVYEHRLVVEKSIGRYLTSDEKVHHIDQNKQNNDIHNLLVLSNQNHIKLHRFLELLEQGGDL